MAWFIAAQIVRTTRQRRRIEVAADAPELDLPGTLTAEELATEHARYILKAIGAIAYIINARPWGLGMSSACLPASDCPVLLLGHQDDEDQLFAAGLSDIAFPLDPHRIIFMPGPALIEDDPRKARDHRMSFDGMGLIFTQAVYDTALEYTFMHPEHSQLKWMRDEGRLPNPGEASAGHAWYINYTPLDPRTTIEKRWAHQHPPQQST